jgi:hypothetical protein
VLLTIVLIAVAVWIAFLIVILGLSTAASQSDVDSERAANFYLQYELAVARQRSPASPTGRA